MKNKQVEQVKKDLKELNKPVKIKSINMRDRENDIRDLPRKDKDQIEFRDRRDNLAYHKLELATLTDIEMFLALIVEKLYGTDDAFALLEQKMLEYECIQNEKQVDEEPDEV